MPADAFLFIADSLIVSDFAHGDMIYGKEQPITHAVFPHDCTLSVMAVMRDGRSAEAGNIGNEGCYGIASGLGDRRATNGCVVQVPGSASLLPMDEFDEAMTRHEGFRDILMRYMKAVLHKTQRFVACSSVHTADMRCCRRLLMMHDRVPGDTFPLTQDELARLLGVRRATIGQICAGLQEAEIIRYSRGIPTTCPSKALGPGVGQRGDGRYSTPAVAALLNVNRSTVAVWCRTGRLDAVRDTPHSSYWVKLTDEIIAELRRVEPRRNHRRPVH